MSCKKIRHRLPGGTECRSHYFSIGMDGARHQQDIDRRTHLPGGVEHPAGVIGGDNGIIRAVNMQLAAREEQRAA